MKTVQDILDEINERQLSLTKMILEDRTSVRTSKMSDTNCPNCGAPRQGRKCEYCGTTFISDHKEEAKLELQRKLQGELATIKIAEQQRQMIQNIAPYRFSPLANTPQCYCVQDSIQQQLNTRNSMANISQCCSIRDSIQQQYDSQQRSALDYTPICNRILTPNEMRGILGFKPSDTFY